MSGVRLPIEWAPVEDGIEAVRNLLPRCRFDAENCRDELKALRSYHRDFNEQCQTFVPHAVHNWSSHTGTVILKDGRRSVPAPRRMRPDAARAT